MSSSSESSFASHMRSIARIVVGFMFCQHGFQKMFGVLGGKPAVFPREVWFAGVIESVGGVLILLGLFTSIAAFLLAGEMVVAVFTVHFPKSFWTVKNGGEAAVLYCFFYLYLIFAGAGPWSLDALLKKCRAKKAAEVGVVV